MAQQLTNIAALSVGMFWVSWHTVARNTDYTSSLHPVYVNDYFIIGEYIGLISAQLSDGREASVARMEPLCGAIRDEHGTITASVARMEPLCGAIRDGQGMKTGL